MIGEQKIYNWQSFAGGWTCFMRGCIHFYKEGMSFVLEVERNLLHQSTKASCVLFLGQKGNLYTVNQIGGF
jgi:hypothetical protein